MAVIFECAEEIAFPRNHLMRKQPCQLISARLVSSRADYQWHNLSQAGSFRALQRGTRTHYLRVL